MSPAAEIEASASRGSSSRLGRDDRTTTTATAPLVRTIDAFLEEAYAHPAAATIIAQSSSSSSASSGHRSQHLTLFRRRLPYHITILSLGLANSSDAAEILCLSYLLSDPTFGTTILHGDVATRGGLLAASVFLGMLLGGTIVGALGDDLGRKPTLLFGLVTNALGGMASALATDAYSMAFIRLIAGVGIGATVPPLFTLVTELSPPSRRGLFVTVVASFWMVGSVYVALAALLSFQHFQWSWRVFAVLCAAPSWAGAVAVWRTVPPSPRFLARHGGRHEEAVGAANELAAKMMGTVGSEETGSRGVVVSMGRRSSGSLLGDSSGPRVGDHHRAFRPLEIEELARLYPRRVGGGAAAARQHGPLDAQGALRSAVQSCLQLYSPHLRFGTTVPLQIVWFALSFGSYGLLTWINSIFVAVHLENLYVNALLFACANLPGNILAGALVDRIGRRAVLTLAMMSSAASLASFAFYARGSSSGSSSSSGGDDEHGSSSSSTFAIVLSACAFQAFSIAGWNALDCITGEVFPTSVRSSGMGICTASGRVGALVAQFVNGALVDKSPVVLLLVASSTLVVGAATPCMLEGEDMAQRSLEDDAVKDHLSDDDDNEDDDNGRSGLRLMSGSGKRRGGRYKPVEALYSSMQGAAAAGERDSDGRAGVLMV